MNTLTSSMSIYGTNKEGVGPIFSPGKNNQITNSILVQQQNNQQPSDSVLYGSRNQGEGQIFLIQQGNLPILQNPVEQSVVSIDVFGTGEARLFQQEQQNQNSPMQQIQIESQSVVSIDVFGTGEARLFQQEEQNQNQHSLVQQNQQVNNNNSQISDRILFGTQLSGTGFNLQNQLQNQQQMIFGTQLSGTGFNLQNQFQNEQQNPQNNDFQTYRKNVYSKLPQQIQQVLHYECITIFLNQIIHNTQNFQLRNYNNNNFYEGELLNEKKHGYGFHFTGKEFYEGQFENDKRQGQGVVVNIDFDYFIGDWQDNHLVGKVLFKNKNQFYDGQCNKNLVPHGKGYLEIQHEYRYKGEFFEGKMHGYGEKKCFIENKQYVGSFVSNKMQGKGRISYQNGKEYEGEFKNNKYEGEGILKDSDGSIYKGQFKNNFKNGYGRLTKVNKEVIEGYWEDDDFIKSK